MPCTTSGQETEWVYSYNPGACNARSDSDRSTRWHKKNLRIMRYLLSMFGFGLLLSLARRSGTHWQTNCEFALVIGVRQLWKWLILILIMICNEVARHSSTELDKNPPSRSFLSPHNGARYWHWSFVCPSVGHIATMSKQVRVLFHHLV